MPRLGPHALAPSPPLALLVACLHRTAHHGTTTRLLWLYDIHLLATTLSDRDWHTVVERAELCGLTPVVVAGLDHAAERLGTVVPASVLDRLRAANLVIEPDMRAFLQGKPSQIQVAASDWRRIAGAPPGFSSCVNTCFHQRATCDIATARRLGLRCRSCTCTAR